MAAIGNPRLAAWTKSDNTVRLYELSGSSFVQVGSSALTVGSDVTTPAVLGFSKDGSHLLGVGKTNLAATTGLLYNWDLTMTLLQAVVSRPNTVTATSPVSAISRTNDIIFSTPAPASNYATALLASGLLDTATTGGGGTSPYPTVFIYAPDESAYFKVINGVNSVTKITAKSGVYPTGGAIAAMTGSVQAVWAEWSTDSKYLYVGCTDGSVEVWAFDFAAGTMTLSQRIPNLGYGAAVRVSVRPGNRYVAISFYDGTTRRTVIFTRLGATLKKGQVLTGIGQFLDWTADGGYLLDAGQKVGYSYTGNGILALASGIMSVLPNNILAQAVSSHALAVVGASLLFDVALFKLLNKDYDAANLKICFLSSAAVYNRAATSAAAVKGGVEASGNNWPEGGKTLTGVALVQNSFGAVFTAARMSQPILGTSGFTFSYAMIYDATNDTPLMWVDYGGSRRIDSAMSLVVDFTGGIIQFAT